MLRGGHHIQPLREPTQILVVAERQIYSIDFRPVRLEDCTDGDIDGAIIGVKP